MTLTQIKEKFLNTPAGKFDNTLTDVIADLETHFQGTSHARNAINASKAANFECQINILQYFNSISTTAYADTIKAAGIEPATGALQDYDLLFYNNDYIVGLYLNNQWMDKCSGDKKGKRFEHIMALTAMPEAFSVLRFKNA